MKSISSIVISIFFSVTIWGKVVYSPLMKPGHVPKEKSAEEGFWYKSDKIEKETQGSIFTLHNPILEDYLSKMVCDIAGEYCSDIRVYIIKNPHFNASMYPNGMMQINTGLLLRAKSKDELAAVLSHEIAHFLLTHQTKRWKKAKNSLGVAAFFDLMLNSAGIDSIAGLLASLSIYSNSRKQEKDADLYGLALLHKAGFKPESASHFWTYIQQERNVDKSKGSRNATFFATHPSTPNRIRDLKKAASLLSKQKNTPRTSYLEIITPLYDDLMQTQLQLKELEQTQVMINRHEELGIASEKIAFYRAEVLRKKGTESDLSLAKKYYKQVLTHGTENHELIAKSYRELAYITLKEEQKKEALIYFTQYLTHYPDADDNAMTQYYINQLTDNHSNQETH